MGIREFEIFRIIIAIVCFAVLGLSSAPAMAINPHKNVIVPFLAAGEREIELNMGTRSHGNNPSAPRESSMTLGYGYAFTNFFKTEIKFNIEQDQELRNVDRASTRVSAIGWENHLLFTERGEYFVDPGIFWEIERPFNRDLGYEVILGALFRKDIKMLELNFNSYLERTFMRQVPEAMRMGYQWQGKYRFFQTANQSTLSFGAQGFGDLGKWDEWSPLRDQIHRTGPALFYRYRTGYNRNALSGSIAYLFDMTERQWASGISDGSSANPNSILRTRAQTFRVQIDWVF